MGLFRNTIEYGPPSETKKNGSMVGTGNPAVSDATMHPQQKKAAGSCFRWMILIAIGYTALSQIVSEGVQEYLNSHTSTISIQQDGTYNMANDLRQQIQNNVRQDLADQGINISE